MKRFPKVLAAMLVIALFVGVCATVSFAADLKKVSLNGTQLTVGHYTNDDLTGNLVLNSANPDVAKETRNLVNNSKSEPYFWSQPYAFNQLKANGGSTIPAIVIDVAKGGAGVNICGYEMTLREFLDCIPFSFEIQATTSADATEWSKVFEDADTAPDWNGADYRCEFPEVTVYKVRILFYDIGEADTAKDDGHWTNLTSDQTRFSLAEIGLLQKANAGTTAPTEAPTETATRPGIAIPTRPTVAPTQAPTAAPTQAPTAAPTQAPTAAPTQAPTAAPTQAPTAAPTVAPTEAPTAAPTAPAAPSETVPVETTAAVETTEPTVAPTEAEPTAAPTEPSIITTVPATAPATAPDMNIAAEGEPDNTWIIIVAIVAAAAIAGGAVFFIIKKKRA